MRTWDVKSLGAPVGQKPAQHRAVAFQELVGELDHARVGPAVLAQLEQTQKGSLLAPRRVLAHQDRRGGLRARHAGMAVHEDMAAG